MTINYTDINSIIAGFNKILTLQNVGIPTNIPTPLILIGTQKRPGLSPVKIASRIIARKGEAGIPIGALPSGGIAPDEIMERIRIEEIVRSLLEDVFIPVAVPPGIALTAAGSSDSGPVTVYGSTITYIKGYGIIQ